VAERLLYLPDAWVSPRLCETIPALRVALQDLRGLFDVEIGAGPAVKGEQPIRDLDDWVTLIKEALTPGCHVVSEATSAMAAVPALAGETDAASFVAIGFFPSEATLKALQLPSAMAAMAVGMVSMGSFPYMRSNMEGASEEEVVELSRAMDADTNLTALGEMARIWQEWNIETTRPRVEIPSLLLEPPGEYEMDDMAVSFRHFVPGAEVRKLASFGPALHVPETGHDLSLAVIEFITKLRA
jgi:hypothetical protein